MRRTAALLIATAFALGACGDDEEDQAGGGATATPAAATGEAQTLAISADPGGAFKWDKDTLTAKAGTVTITMANPSDLPHAVEIEGNGVEEVGETVEKGGTSTATAELGPGTYEYYCPVGNHKDGGMTGTLTVE